MSRDATLPVCKYFIRDGCARGDQCYYYHPESSAVASRPARPSACSFFLQGTCRYGTRCRDLHPSSEETWPRRAPSSSTSAFGPCKFFSRGQCMKGGECPFSHNLTRLNAGPALETQPLSKSSTLISKPTTVLVSAEPEVLKPRIVPFPEALSASESVLEALPASAHGQTEDEEEEKVKDSSLYSERTMFGCKVIFGPGALLRNIVTSFESRRLILSSVPFAATYLGLLDLLQKFGEVERLFLDSSSTPSFQIARVDFVDSSAAASAAQGLNEKIYLSSKLTAAMDLTRVESGAATLLSRKIKMSWYAPSRIAWAHYGTIAKARRRSTELNGVTFEGRKVVASLQTPGLRQKTSFSVELKGLPTSFDRTRLQRLCQANSITVGDATYERALGIQSMRQRIEDYGALDAFDVLPENRAKAKITAFAQFSTPQGAAGAVNAMHGKPQSFLRGSPAWMELVHSVKYMVHARQFMTLKAKIDALRDSHESCKIRYYEIDDKGAPVDPVCIRIHGTAPKSIGQAKVELDALLAGNSMAADGEHTWDEFFATVDGRAFVETVSAATNCFVKCDTRLRDIRLFGETSGVAEARTLIQERLSELAEERHVLHLERKLLRHLLTGGFRQLQAIVEPDSLTLNIVDRLLIVRGDEADIRRIQSAIAAFEDKPSGPVLESDALCPVCFCDATDPIQLSCGHTYCTACIKHLLLAARGSSECGLLCIEEVTDDEGKGRACNAPISLNLIRDLLSPQEEAQLLESAFLAHIHARPDEFRYCPTPDCPTIYRPEREGTVLQCPACVSRICPACHVEFHEGLTCEEQRDNASGGLLAYQKWRTANGVKPCPKCGADLQKNGGCNHIKCIRCRTHICWVCMKTFSDQGSGGGVYEHMSIVHGGIGV